MKLDFSPDPYGVAAHAVYEASAGSGKTHQLTNRYLRLLLAGLRVEALGEKDNPFAPERILATTFTRKAAGEIRARVIQRLFDADALAKSLAQVEEGRRSETHVTPDEVRRLLRLVAARMHRLRIGTMDAFVGGLATALAPELGISADAMVVEEQWALAAQVRESAIEAALDDLGGRLGEETLRALHEGFHGDVAAGAVLAPLATTVQKLLALYRENPRADWGLPPQWCRGARLAEEEIAELAENLRLWSLEDWKHKGINTALAKDAELVGSPEWERQVKATAGLWDKARKGDATYQKKPLSLELMATYGRLLGHVDACEFDRLATMFTARKMFLTAYSAGERAVRQRAGVAHYSDAMEQLAELDEVFKPALYEKLDGRLDHLLFDEFQDTSRAQWQLFAPLMDELRAGGERERSTLVVGDPKQAIYGWRGGCVDLFKEAQVGAGTYPLAVSYRSSPAIMQAVNQVFAGIAGNGALMHDRLDGAALRSAWEAFAPHHAHRQDMPGCAQLVTLGVAPNATEEEGEEEGQGVYAKEVAAHVARTLSAHDFQSAGVLVRGNAMGQSLLTALRAVMHKAWSVEGENGRLLADQPAAAACLARLRLADAPDDLIAAAQVASSPLSRAPGSSPFSQEEIKAYAAQASREVRAQLAQSGLLATLAAWRASALAHCDAQAVSALDHLLVLAAAFEQNDRLRSAGCGRFLAYVADQALPGGSAGHDGRKTLRVMTIHKSKGLEFDAVFLPDLHGKLQGQVAQAEAWVDRASPAQPPRRVLPNLNEAQVGAFGEEAAKLSQAVFTAQVQESLCVLYVGMTRAQRFLAMLVPPIAATQKGLSTKGREDMSAAALLRHAFGAPMDKVEEGAGEQVLWHAQHGVLPPPGPRDTGPALVAATAFSPIAFGSQKQKRGFAFTSPSIGAHAVEAGAGVATDAAASDHAKALGSLVHAYFERVGFADEASAPDLACLLDLAKQAQLAPTVAEEAQRIIAAALASPAIAAGLSRRGAASLRAEQPLLGCNAQGKPVFGICDRMTVWEADGRPIRAEIIDFKTDMLAGPGLAAQARLRHGAQMNAYRALVAQALGLPAEAVGAKLAMLRAGEMVEV